MEKERRRFIGGSLGRAQVIFLATALTLLAKKDGLSPPSPPVYSNNSPYVNLYISSIKSQEEINALLTDLAPPQNLKEQQETSPPTITPTEPSPTEAPPPPPSEEKKPIETPAQQTLPQVIQSMENHPEVFSQKDIEDIKIYYPIYYEAGQKYNVDWRILWIVHNQETGCSQSPETDVISDNYYGAMQRNIRVYPDRVAENALSGIEDLKDIPTRQPNDAREIAFAAWKLNNDRDPKGGVLAALYAYSSATQARKRIAIFQEVNNLLPG